MRKMPTVGNLVHAFPQLHAHVLTCLLASTQMQKRIYSQHKVRTSMQDRTLDSMVPVTNPSQVPAGTSVETSRTKEIRESECILSSVSRLRADVLQGRHDGGIRSAQQSSH